MDDSDFLDWLEEHGVDVTDEDLEAMGLSRKDERDKTRDSYLKNSITEKSDTNLPRLKALSLSSDDSDALSRKILVIRSTVKDLAHIFKNQFFATSFEGLPHRIQTSFMRELEKVDALTKNVILKHYNLADYVYDPDAEKSNYDRLFRVIRIDKNNSSTIAHELFHRIDHLYNIAGQGTLQKAFRKDEKNLMDYFGDYNRVVEMLQKRFPEAFVDSNNSIMYKLNIGVYQILFMA